jgi:hypothetical protein
MFGINAIPTCEVLQTKKKNNIKNLVSVNGTVLYLYFPREKLAFLAHLDLKPCELDAMPFIRKFPRKTIPMIEIWRHNPGSHLQMK